MKTKGNRVSSNYRKLRTYYLRINGYSVIKDESSQIVVDRNGNKICDYHSLPVESYLRAFYSETSKFNEGDITPQILENAHNEAKTAEVRDRYHKFFGLEIMYLRSRFCVFHCGEYLHTDKDYPTDDQLEAFLRMSRSRQAQILEKIKNALGDEPTSETMKVLLEEAWWDDNISRCMKFLDF